MPSSFLKRFPIHVTVVFHLLASGRGACGFVCSSLFRARACGRSAAGLVQPANRIEGNYSLPRQVVWGTWQVSVFKQVALVHGGGIVSRGFGGKLWRRKER